MLPPVLRRLEEALQTGLRSPFGCRTLGDAEVKDSPPLMLDHEEHKQSSQADRGYKEKVDCCNLLNVILQECLPGLADHWARGCYVWEAGQVNVKPEGGGSSKGRLLINRDSTN